jgi:hypothetical protein
MGIGALVGAGIYLASDHTSFSAGELAAAMGVGAVGGTLISTGAFALTGVAMVASIGAGTGILASEVGYTVVAQDQFDTGDMVTAAAIGGVDGAVSAVTKSPAVRLAVSGVAGAGQEAITELRHGPNVDPINVAVATGLGVTTGALGELTGGPGSYTMSKYPDVLGKHVAEKTAAADLRKWARAEYLGVAAKDTLRSGVIESFGNAAQPGWDWLAHYWQQTAPACTSGSTTSQP